MKFRINLLFLLSFSSILWISCSEEKGRVSSPSPDSVTWVITSGEDTFRNLISELTTTLQQSVHEKGFVGAIDMCNLEALPLTQKISDTSDKITGIKRTSYQFRNRKNKPDSYERTALDYFQRIADRNEPLPSYYVQKVEKQSEEFFRYYKPLKMMPSCLNCHGKPEDMNSEVVEILNNKYPKDKAIGYNLNDFRGVVSITISEAQTEN